MSNIVLATGQITVYYTTDIYAKMLTMLRKRIAGLSKNSIIILLLIAM